MVSVQDFELDEIFLYLDVNVWHGSRSYKESMDNICALNVINDAAERGVKLAMDYSQSAKSEEHYQNVIQVVENDRKTMPNLTKRKNQS